MDRGAHVVVGDQNPEGVEVLELGDADLVPAPLLGRGAVVRGDVAAGGPGGDVGDRVGERFKA